MVTKLKLAQVYCLMVLLLLLLACQTQSPPTPTIPPTPSATPESTVKTIRLTNGEFPPYLSETMPEYGIASQIVTEAFALQGVTVEYGFFPWARSLALAQEGTWDGTLIWTKNEEREKDFYFSDMVVSGNAVFFHLNSYSFNWDSFEDLKGLRIGGTLEYNYGEEFKAAEEAGVFTVERVPADIQNFEKLLAGRIDIFPMTQEIGQHLIQQSLLPEQVAQITFHPKAVHSEPAFLLLSRQVEGNEEMMRLFNLGLQELRDSGRLQEIIDETLQLAN